VFALLASVIVAQFLPTEADSLRIEGRCFYPPQLVEQAQSWRLVECGEAELTPDGIAFASRGFPASVRFIGQWQGGSLDIGQVVLHGRDGTVDARGWCRLDHRGAEISAIACSVVAGPRSFIVNFIVPNI
jgi:hypothetical protein